MRNDNLVFKREDVVSNLYETSKSSKEGTYLLDKKHQEIEVYDFDNVAKILCIEYRNKQNLKSCDAYYENTPKKDYLVMEFKIQSMKS